MKGIMININEGINDVNKFKSMRYRIASCNTILITSKPEL